MIAKWILTALGLSAPIVRDDQDIASAMRRARAAAFQQQKITSRAQSAAVDMIIQHLTDPRPSDALREAEKTREMMDQMLGRMK